MSDDRDLISPERWDARYAASNTPWDLGGPPPILTDLIPTLPGRHRVLVPGAGRGHDAFAWARAGHEVVAVDFAPLAIDAMRRLAAERSVAVEALQADVLALPDALAGAFDLVWEHTCFCALPRRRRADYLAAMARALRPDGALIALLWNHGMPDEQAPPYDVTREDVDVFFAARFEVESVEPVAVSAPGRSRELLALMRRR